MHQKLDHITEQVDRIVELVEGGIVMPPDVYYQVKVVVGYADLVVLSKTMELAEVAAEYLVRNHLTPCETEAVAVKKLLEYPPSYIITAWVKDELCENYKPKGE